MIRHSLIWCGLAAALTVSGPALGQDYPNRQVIILVGIAVGGITDVTTRQYAAVLSKNMDQNILVENRPIAGGAIAAAGLPPKLHSPPIRRFNTSIIAAARR
jgi:tripartite-type tricarboxylate transporter receptor subunit TctC